ncbi:MAG: long-chain fatty acid--CoA ligase [Longimicrobiales bacterium]
MESATGRATGVAVEPYERDTLARVFLGAVDRFGPEEAFRWKEAGEWRSLTHDQAGDQVARMAAALRARGVRRGDRVALLSENRPEWALTDFTAACAGAVSVPVYPTLPADQVGVILEDSEPTVAIVSTVEQAEKILAVRDRVPALTHVVVMDPTGPRSAADVGGGAPNVTVETWASLLETEPDPGFRDEALAAAPGDLATLIYTSGTTGVPKGAMLTHGNLAYMVAATRQHRTVPAGPGDVALSILPLSHVLERAASLYFWDAGAAIAYAESIDAVSDNLMEIRPHLMVSVPRLFEKIHQKVVGGGGLKGQIARWASDVGSRVVDRRHAGRSVPITDRIRFALADRLVFSKLREKTGGRLRMFISGGAPLAADVARLFFAAGMPIHEGYGLTETSPVLAANQPGHVKLGTVGRPYPGVELRLGDEDEILARTPGLMSGYWKNPEATARAIGPDGWFHTGDIGSLDADGYLTITDRLKDIIVTAGGKNIAPQPIELHATRSPFVAQAVVIGDRRPFPVLLVVPDWERLDEWAVEEEVEVADRLLAADNERVRALLEAQTLGRMDRFAHHETPKRIAVIAEEFTVEEELLTPTLKVRRRAVEERYGELIGRLYERASRERR